VRVTVLDALEGSSRNLVVSGACGVERSAIEISKSGRQVVANGACEEVIGLPGDVFVGGEDGGGRVAQ